MFIGINKFQKLPKSSLIKVGNNLIDEIISQANKTPLIKDKASKKDSPQLDPNNNPRQTKES
jgi:hypothetical protein